MNRSGWIWAAGLLGLGGLQFLGPERTNPPVRTEIDAPEAVRAVLRRACYDCHSHETRWPWYSRVAPVSWFVIGHVNKGRGDLNFSEWPTFDFEEDREAREDIRKQVRAGKMPLRSYLILHPDARLSAAEKELLLGWAAGP